MLTLSTTPACLSACPLYTHTLYKIYIKHLYIIKERELIQGEVNGAAAAADSNRKLYTPALLFCRRLRRRRKITETRNAFHKG